MRRLGATVAFACLMASSFADAADQAPTTPSNAETSYWNWAKNSRNPQDFTDYIEKYPGGAYVTEAKVKIASLKAAAAEEAEQSGEPIDTGPVAPVQCSAVNQGGGTGAKLFVYAGRTYWPGGSQPGLAPLKFDVAADGGHRVRLKPGQYLEFDLAPGKHEVTPSEVVIDGARPAKPTEIGLAEGQCGFYALNHYQGISPARSQSDGAVIGAGAAGGLLGVVIVAVAVGTAEAATTRHHNIAGHDAGDWLVPDPGGPTNIAALSRAQ